MPGEKSQKSKKKGGDDKSQKSKSKSKGKQKAEKSVTKGDKKQKSVKDSKAKKQTSKKSVVDDQSQMSAILPQSSDCIHHKSPFIYYCQTCQQLVCNQCTVYGPHNNHLHRILKITDAYRSRVFYLSEAIRSNLVDKRDKIIAQLHRLQYRIEEIRFVKGIIERDIRSEYSGILERLKSFEGIKLAKVSHQVSLTQREIDAINDLGNQFFTLTSMDCEQIEQERKICKFLTKSKQMYQAIEYIINKPQRELPNLEIEQIPREIQTNRGELQKALAAKELNNFKNQLIWNLNCELTNQQNYVKDQIQQKADMVLKNLCNDVQNLSMKLNNYKMVCYYCGVPSTPQAIRHNICDKNMHGVDSLKIGTEKTPDEKYNFNGRHFFSYQVKNNN